jgi:hypothetical protein
MESIIVDLFKMGIEVINHSNAKRSVYPVKRNRNIWNDVFSSPGHGSQDRIFPGIGIYVYRIKAGLGK